MAKSPAALSTAAPDRSQGGACVPGQRRVAAQGYRLAKPTLGRIRVVLSRGSAAGAKIQAGGAWGVVGQFRCASGEGKAPRQRVIIQQVPSEVAGAQRLGAGANDVALAKRDTRGQLGGVRLLLGPQRDAMALSSRSSPAVSRRSSAIRPRKKLARAGAFASLPPSTWIAVASAAVGAPIR